MEAKILAATRTRPLDGSTHWSTRRLGKHLGVSHAVVHRAWRRANLRPHRLERYLASNDPDFEKKAADVIGLYLNPPENAVVFSVDEKTAIQALDRTVPVLPMSPGRAERHGFEYYRHGTRSLLAALDTQTGEVRGKTLPRIGGEPFLAFLKEIVASQPPQKEIHVIADNLSSHKTKRVKAFVEANPNFHMHYTPTYSSWLNQIELWFSKLKRDVLARGVFTSTAEPRTENPPLHPRAQQARQALLLDLQRRSTTHHYSTYRYSPLVALAGSFAPNWVRSGLLGRNS